jgi:alanine racemase
LTNRHEYELLLKAFGILKALYGLKQISTEKAYNKELQNLLRLHFNIVTIKRDGQDMKNG